MEKRWITNTHKLEALEFIEKYGNGRNLIIDDPIATDCFTVEELKTEPTPYVGIYEVIEE